MNNELDVFFSGTQSGRLSSTSPNISNTPKANTVLYIGNPSEKNWIKDKYLNKSALVFYPDISKGFLPTPPKLWGQEVFITPEEAELKIRSTDKVDPTTATKFDSGKTDWSLMPFDAVEQINKVLEFGAKKYAAGNWKNGGGFKYTRVLNCLIRHVFAYMRGEDNDPESGLSHLAHAGCNVLFLLHYSLDKKKYINDDRNQV